MSFLPAFERIALPPFLPALDGRKEVIRGFGFCQGGEEQGFVAPADVSRTEDVKRALDQAASRFGSITTMANCHGISLVQDTRIVDVPEETFDQTIAVNLRGIFILCKYGLPHLKRVGGGAIVNLASGAALFWRRRHVVHGQQGRRHCDYSRDRFPECGR